MATAKRAAKSKRGRKVRKPCAVCGKLHAVWWASNKGRWMLTTPDQKQLNLGADHDDAIRQWHRIEAGELEPKKPEPITATGDAILVGDLNDAFLAALKGRIATGKIGADRYANSKRMLTEFVREFGNSTIARLRVGGVARIETWLAEKTTWGSKADPISRIKQLFNWGVAQGFIPSSPVKALESGKHGARVSYFTAEQEAAIFKDANPHFSKSYRLVLLTGCRPDEVCSLEASDVHDDASGFYLLVEHKNQRHTGKRRRIFLVPEAEKIVREALEQHPKGRLFRSGNKTDKGYPPLSPEYFNQYFTKLRQRPNCKKLGLDDYETVAEKRLYKYVPYTARHTFAVRYLTGFYRDAKGRPIILTYGEVAALLGNSAKMVEKIYGHLVDQTKFLSDRLTGRFD